MMILFIVSYMGILSWAICASLMLYSLYRRATALTAAVVLLATQHPDIKKKLLDILVDTK